MLERVLLGLGQLLVRRRWLFIGGLLAVALTLGLQIPNIKADFTPSDLFARFEDQERIAADFRATFGNTDHIILVLVEADSVFTLEVMQAVHDISRHFQSHEDVDRVESLTMTYFSQDPEPTADGDQAEDQDQLETTGLEALADLVGDLFGSNNQNPSTDSPQEPLGLVDSLTGGRPVVAPLVAGDTVTPEEVEALWAALQDAPLVNGRLVSEDGTVAAVVLVLSENLTRNTQVAEFVANIEAWLEAENLTGDGATDALSVHLGGLPYVRTAVVDLLKADQSLLLPLSLLVCLLLLWGSFRWIWGMAFPTLAVLISAVILVGSMAVVGEPFNILNNIVPMLVIIIGLSNSIHFITRYTQELREYPDRSEASARTVRSLAVALFLTTSTTAVGFYSLAVSDTPILERFGFVAGTGILLSYVVTLALVPAALTLVKRPRMRKRKTRHRGGTHSRLENTLEDLTRWILARPIKILVGSSVLFVAMSLSAWFIVVDSRVLDQIAEDDEIAVSFRLIEDKLGGLRPLEVSLSSSVDGRFEDPDVLNAMAALQQDIGGRPEVLSTMSYVDLLKEVRYRIPFLQTPREDPFVGTDLINWFGQLLSSGPRDVAAPYVTSNRRRARINFMLEDVGVRGTVVTIDVIRNQALTLFQPFEDVEVVLTGDAYVGSRGLDSVVTDLRSSLFVAVIIIFGIMTLTFRSLRLGLISVPPNLIPLVGTLAYMVARGIQLNAATVIIFSISIGLAVDGSIHVLARFREEIRQGYVGDEVLIRAARGTGKAIIYTCFSLIIGFGVMLLSSFVPVRRFGELIAVTTFSCLLATLIVLPALLKVAWPSDRPTPFTPRALAAEREGQQREDRGSAVV